MIPMSKVEQEVDQIRDKIYAKMKDLSKEERRKYVTTSVERIRKEHGIKTPTVPAEEELVYSK
jgi:hypothetical protein